MAYYDETHLKRLRDIQEIKGNTRMPIAFLKERMSALDRPGPGGQIEDVKQTKDVATTNKAKDRKRERIVKAAIEVFSQKGYHRTKVRDITDSIGISTGTFYIYFKNKSDLFVEVVDDVIRSILGDATGVIRSEQDIVKRMEVRGRVFYERYSRYNEILHQLRAEMAGEDRWPQEKIKKAYHDLTRPLMRDIQKGIDKGVYRLIDPDLLAYALTGIIEIMSLRMMIDKKYTFDEIMAFVGDFVTYGMGAGQQTTGGAVT
jgi:AcrR family transcriptional regulator